jgi:hypothetical protein
MIWFASWIINRFVGNDSSDWALAMRREFDELESGHLEWAVGCASTVIFRRTKSEAPFISALIFLPILSLICGVPISLAGHWLLKDIGVPHGIMSLPIILSQLPFAIWLGIVGHRNAPLIVGTLGFVSQEFLPQLILAVLSGVPFHFWWGPNVTVYSMTPAMGYACSAAMWIAGALWGSRLKRNRLLTH